MLAYLKVGKATALSILSKKVHSAQYSDATAVIGFRRHRIGLKLLSKVPY